MEDLFGVLLQDTYFAERQILRALVPLSEAVCDPLLRNAFSVQRFDTREQIERLDEIFEIIGRSARDRHCSAIVGLLADAEDVVARTSLGSVRDAGILAATQAVGQYQIARYRTLIAMAERLGEFEAAGLLRISLEEEKAADTLLGQVAAESLNPSRLAA